MIHLREEIIERAEQVISNKDRSHDFHHALRVLYNAEHISTIEGGDSDIIIPAALLHDSVNYPKDDPKAHNAAEESAKLAEKILKNIETYPKEKIPLVMQAILEHSFSKGITPTMLESKIVQDADRLETTGAIAIMRTFCSTGQMKRAFYHAKDPFCHKRSPDCINYALDLFKDRLLKVKDLMNTNTAKVLAEQRTDFLAVFLNQLNRELFLLDRYTKNFPANMKSYRFQLNL